MKRIKRCLAVAGLASTLAISGAVGAKADHRNDTDWSHLNILLLIWSQASNPFFEPLVNGARDAAAQQGVTIDVQFGEEDPVRTTNILETSIATGIDAIAFNMADDDAYNNILCGAEEQGTPVVTFNIDHSQGHEGTCRLAFMGQDFVETGYLIGRRMIEEHGLKEGDHVFTPVEAPEGTYAVLRHRGLQMAMEEIGATTEILGTGNDHGQALDLMTQYLLGHSETAAVIGLGQTPTSQAVRAIRDAGLNIPAGGFDVSESILQNIADGDLTATVDQQPYSQGYYAVTQLALALKFGLYPSEMNTGGRGLIDKTNFQFAEEWAGEVR